MKFIFEKVEGEREGERVTFVSLGIKGHERVYFLMCNVSTSLVVQWLILYAGKAEGLGSIPGWGTRSHMP